MVHRARGVERIPPAQKRSSSTLSYGVQLCNLAARTALKPPSTSQHSVHLSPGRLLHYQYDQIILGSFYTHYCVDGSTISSLDHIRRQGCLFAAIKVLGNLEISRRWLLRNDLETTTLSYLNATRALNAALASPEQATRDSTLLATMILTAVETKIAPSHTLDYWEAHTHGASALLAMRGVSQVRSRLGSALYFQVSSIMVTNCLLSGRRIPQSLLELRSCLTTCVFDTDHPVWKQQGFSFRLTELAASVHMMEHDCSEAQMLCECAAEIYTDLLSVFEGAAPAWHYRKVPCSRFPHLLDYEHVYQSVLATQTWNEYRLVLLVLCALVIRISNRFPGKLHLRPQSQDLVSNASRLINEAALETVAAVTQSIALIADKAAEPLPPFTLNDWQARYLCSQRSAEHLSVFHGGVEDQQSLPYMYGCSLQWAVYFAADCEFVDYNIRLCLLDILESAGRSMQVTQWQILAERLRQAIKE